MPSLALVPFAPLMAHRAVAAGPSLAGFAEVDKELLKAHYTYPATSLYQLLIVKPALAMTTASGALRGHPTHFPHH